MRKVITNVSMPSPALKLLADTTGSELSRSQVATAVTVADLPRRLEPIGRAPLVKGLDGALADGAAVETYHVSQVAQARRGIHERQRTRVRASLLGPPAR